MQYLFVFKNIQTSFFRDLIISLVGFFIGFFLNLISFNSTFLIALFIGAIGYKNLKNDERSFEEIKKYIAIDVFMAAMLTSSFVNTKYILNNLNLANIINICILFIIFFVFYQTKFSVIKYFYNKSRAFNRFIGAILCSLLSVFIFIIVAIVLNKININAFNIDFILH